MLFSFDYYIYQQTMDRILNIHGGDCQGLISCYAGIRSIRNWAKIYAECIVASSAKGPRGDKVLSAQLSDKLENLMLMCADHHKLIDQPTTGPRDYPVDKLTAMKKAHEEKIDRMLPYLNQKENAAGRYVTMNFIWIYFPVFPTKDIMLSHI